MTRHIPKPKAHQTPRIHAETAHNPGTPWRGKSPATAGCYRRAPEAGTTRIERGPRGAVVIETPPDVQVEVGPAFTHDHRVQCAPNEQPFGAGFAAAGPGIDITTGRGWGR